MSSVAMAYGSYNFLPIPNVNMTRDFRKTEDNRILSTVMRISLDGVLVTLGGGGVTVVAAAQQALAAAMAQNGALFTISCNGTPFLSCNPKINALSFKNTPNNWVDSVGYTIELEYSDNISDTENSISNATLLDNISEDWDMEPMEDKQFFSWNVQGSIDSRPYLYKLTHKLSAKGRNTYSAGGVISGGIEGWQFAANWVSGRLGLSNIGNFSMPTTNPNFSYYNYNRVQSMNKFAGTYGANESWIVFNSGVGVSGMAIEDFIVDIKAPYDNDLITANVQGTIQGLATVSYSTADVISQNVTTSKFAAASGYFKAMSGLIYSRAQQAVSIMNPSARALWPGRIGKTIGFSPGNGTINYSFEYSNKPAPMIDGALNENINMTVEYPQDVYAPMTILGRVSGPLLQFMGTRTYYQYNLTMDVVVPLVVGTNPASDWLITNAGCPHNKASLYLAEFEQNFLVGAYSSLAKTADHISWNPREGKYGRAVTWIGSTCGDSTLVTSVSGFRAAGL